MTVIRLGLVWGSVGFTLGLKIKELEFCGGLDKFTLGMEVIRIGFV